MGEIYRESPVLWARTEIDILHKERFIQALHKLHTFYNRKS